MRGEFELIESVRRRVADGAGVKVGIGDDCAVLAGGDGWDVLVTTDLLIEERHFLADAAPHDLGWKALAVSISDVAAMGGSATAAFVAVALPAARTGTFADELTGGLLACAQRFGVTLAGGDTTGTPGPIVLCTTVVGRVESGRAILRSGARPGDVVLVTGALGGSLLGRHLRPEPRQDAARSLVQDRVATAMIDLSDGLSSDLGHVLDASGGGAVVWADRVPLHADAHAASGSDGRTVLEHALHDGEDFELLFTAAPEDAVRLVREGLGQVPVAAVGRITAEPGLVLAPSRESEAVARPLQRGGYEHLAD